MKNIIICALLTFICSCTLNSLKIVEKTARNLQSEKTINYQYNQLTIQGSSENDTTFIEMFSTASFQKDMKDKFLGYTYVIQDSLIHPYFDVPLKTTYHYNGTVLNTAMVSPIRNSLETNDTTEINKNVYKATSKNPIFHFQFVFSCVFRNRFRSNVFHYILNY